MFGSNNNTTKDIFGLSNIPSTNSSTTNPIFSTGATIFGSSQIKSQSSQTPIFGKKQQTQKIQKFTAGLFGGQAPLQKKPILTQQQKKIQKQQQQNKSLKQKISSIQISLLRFHLTIKKFQQNQQKNQSEIQNLKKQINTLKTNIPNNQNPNQNQQYSNNLSIIENSLLQLKTQNQQINFAINIIANHLNHQNNQEKNINTKFELFQNKINSNFNQLFNILSNHPNMTNYSTFSQQNKVDTSSNHNPMLKKTNQMFSNPNNFSNSNFNQGINQNLRYSQISNNQNQRDPFKNNQSFNLSNNNNNFDTNLKRGGTNPMAQSAVFSPCGVFNKSCFRDGYEIQQSTETGIPALVQVGNQHGKIVMINNKDFRIHPQEPVEKYFKIRQNVVEVMNEKLENTYKIRLITYNFMNSRNIDPSQKDAFESQLIDQIAADKLIFEYWDRNTGNLSLLTK